jgi:hypothetical protein
MKKPVFMGFFMSYSLKTTSSSGLIEVVTLISGKQHGIERRARALFKTLPVLCKNQSLHRLIPRESVQPLSVTGRPGIHALWRLDPESQQKCRQPVSGTQCVALATCV